MRTLLMRRKSAKSWKSGLAPRAPGLLLAVAVAGAAGIAGTAGCDGTHGIWVSPVVSRSEKFGGSGGQFFDASCGPDQLVTGYAKTTRPSGLFGATSSGACGRYRQKGRIAPRW